MIPFYLLTNWMNYIRENPDNAHRFTECFYSSQMISKKYAMRMIGDTLQHNGSVYIFGGWYGVFAQILNEKYPNKYYNIDLDPSCEEVFENINYSSSIAHITADMAEFDYLDNPLLVINTSTEHVSQETYNVWWNKIPKGTKYFIQGNNFYECDEHVRCCNSLAEFVTLNHVEDCFAMQQVKCGMRPDGSPFYRYMALGTR